MVPGIFNFLSLNEMKISTPRLLFVAEYAMSPVIHLLCFHQSKFCFALPTFQHFSGSVSNFFRTVLFYAISDLFAFQRSI